MHLLDKKKLQISEAFKGALDALSKTMNRLNETMVQINALNAAVSTLTNTKKQLSETIPIGEGCKEGQGQ